MRIRRYLGHDADSINGFNNGYYLDDADGIEAKDHDEASRLCLKALDERYVVDAGELTKDDYGYTLTTSYSDDNGNEITREEFLNLNEDSESGSYRYVFVNYVVVE